MMVWEVSSLLYRLFSAAMIPTPGVYQINPWYMGSVTGLYAILSVLGNVPAGTVWVSSDWMVKERGVSPHGEIHVSPT